MENKFAGVHITGPEQAPALVLLHSSMSNNRQWSKLVAQLKQEFLIINIDLLGYGSAPEVEGGSDFSLGCETARIEQILQGLNVCQFHLVGHSYGGATALKYAFEHKQQVLSLVLFEAVAFHLLDKHCDEWQEITQVSTEMLQYDALGAAQLFVDYWNGRGFFASVPKAMQQQFSLEAKKVLLDFQALTTEAYRLQDYAQLELPVLLLSGSHSRASSLKVTGLLARHLKHSSHKQVAAGHMAPISHAQDVNPLITAFLTDVKLDYTEQNT